MAYYHVPTYAQTFIHGRGRIIYSSGTVVVPPPIVTPVPTIVAPGTVVTPGAVISQGIVKPPVIVAGGGVIQSPTVQTIDSSSGSRTVIIQNPSPSSVVVYQNGSGSQGLVNSFSQAAASVVQDASRTLMNEADKYARSPLLDCFMPGCGIQLRSKVSGGVLRIHEDGSIDCNGRIGNEYNVVQNQNNTVILQNGEFNAYYLSINDGLATAAMFASYFHLHETPDQCVTLRLAQTGQYLGVDRENNVLPTDFVQPYSEEAKFKVHLAYSPYGHRYETN